jgi:coenzyme F420-0:L-glutamate ligase/coenzyme F420-1:gamma-L-glutamate ligase
MNKITRMNEITIAGVPGLPEITPGDNLAELILAATPDLADGDILVVTSKIISKAEGRVITSDRDNAIATETVRVVARRGPTTIAQTRHGLVMAAAGVDRSNTAPGTVVLLPEDPDESARRLRKKIGDLAGAKIGVLITDTMGRPWRNGQTDAAIGAAGVLPLRDHRGQTDSFGNVLEVTVTAVADEIAAAGELVKGKTDQVPVALVRGLAELVIPASAGSSPASAARPPSGQVGGDVPGTAPATAGQIGVDVPGTAPATAGQIGGDGPGAAALVRPAAEDMFRLGAADVLGARRTVRDFTADPVDPAAVRRAIAAALTAPAPHHSQPWRFAVVESESAKTRLLDAMLAAWVADLRGDGFTEEQIARRTRRGEPLRRAPLLIVPCLLADAAHTYPDERRNASERSMFLVSMGAGVQNLLVALAVEGLGSCWISSTLFCGPVATAALELPDGWEPMGAVGVGHAASPPAPRPDRDPEAFIIDR